jgi:hypothetical protein
MNAVRTLILGFALLGVFSWVAVSQGQAPSGTRPGSTPAADPAPLVYPTPAGQHVFGGYRFVHPTSQESVQLAQQYVKATKEDDKKEILKKLTDILNQQFDQHVQQQQKELEDLEKQIADLRALLRKRTDAKAKIVQRRIDQLVQDAEGLGWNSPASPHAGGWMSGSPFAPKPSTRPALTPAPKVP